MTIRWSLQPDLRHIPYWNDVLQEDYCHHDGEPWPCLWYRQNKPPKCLCSHVAHENQCWSRACGCREYRPNKPIPARFDERYDPSPEPIDRSIQ